MSLTHPRRRQLHRIESGLHRADSRLTGTPQGHRLLAPWPERTRHTQGADGRPDPADRSLRP